MLIEFDGKRYPYRGLDLTPRQIMALQVELVDADFTTVRTFQDIRRLERELMDMDKDERVEHPEIMFYSAVVVYSALATAGVKVTLAELLDNPRLMDSVRQIPEPGDHQESEGKARSHRSGSAVGNHRKGQKKSHR